MSQPNPNNSDAVLGGQSPIVYAAVLGGVSGKKQRLTKELGLSGELASQLVQTHNIFSFETVTMTEQNEIVEIKTIMDKEWDKLINRQQKQAFYYTEDLGDGIDLEMVYIPAGALTIEEDFQPQITIDIPSFHLAKYPITQAQYQAVVGNNPAYFNAAKGYPYSNRMPVEGIRWHDAQEFCRLLKSQTGKQYQLPDEFQWEYACRAGAKTELYFGKFNGYSLNCLLNCVTYRSKDLKRTNTVGLFPPNSFGLYDMHGNVWEWCEDRQPEKPKSDFGNPRGVVWDTDGKNNLIKGGAWNIYPTECSATFRGAATIVEGQTKGLLNCLGFRAMCI